jgi:hypothetical protein
MKAIILILLFLPIVCFSQNRNNTAPSKPSATACPDFNDKKKPTNKADYYKSLRSMKKVKKTNTVVYNTPKSEPKAEIKKSVASKTQPQEKEVKEQPEEKVETNEKEITKKKTKRLPRRNTTKAKKRNASACPNF